MTKEVVDTNMVKNWYLQVWKDFVEVDAQFMSLRKRRDKLQMYLSSLEPILGHAGINVEELRRSIEPTEGMETEQMEPKTLPELIEEVLRESTGPMHYKDILAVINQKGRIVPGKDPGNTLIAYMNRFKRRFTKAPGKGRGYYKLIELEK